MTDTPPRGIAAAPTTSADTTPSASSGRVDGARLPAQQSNAGRINIDVQVGPKGLQLVAMRSGSIVLARSGWTMDVDAAYVSLGIALAPLIARIANRTVAPPRDDA